MDCPFHKLSKITHVCFKLPSKGEKCSSRLKCAQCCDPLQSSHPKSHEKYTFQISTVVSEDLSLDFFQLFFTVSQIRTLFRPLQINCEDLSLKLTQIIQRVTNPQHKSELLLEIPGLITLAAKINESIKHFHTQYNNKYDFDSMQKFFSMFLENQLEINIAEEVILEILQWLQCALKFISNVYIIDGGFDTLNLSAELTLTEGLLLEHNVRRELYHNLNHVRQLFFASQPAFLESSQQNIPPPILTSFPLAIKKFSYPISMIKTIGIKTILGLVLVIKQFEVQVFEQFGKLRNQIYSSFEIIDATINPCDVNSLVILQADGNIIGYQLSPGKNVFEKEQTLVITLGKVKYIGVDYIRPQREIEQNSFVGLEEELESTEVSDILALKSNLSVTLFDATDGSTISEFSKNNQMVKIIFADQPKETTTTTMEDDGKEQNKNQEKNTAVCFRKGYQIDVAHYINKAIFEKQDVKSLAYSQLLGQLAILTNEGITVTNKDGSVFAQVRFPEIAQNGQIKCMGYTVDQTYLFVLYENSSIYFFHSLDKYELEYTAQVFKSSLVVQACFQKHSNKIFALNKEGVVYYIDLSSPRQFI